MIRRLKEIAQKHQCERIVFVYEASGLGFGLSDELHREAIECYVLSPTHLPTTPKSAKLKTDAKDAQMLLQQVKGHVLAGNDLPVVWTPPQRLRDDRELVRARIDVGDELTRVKLKIISGLKRRGIDKPAWYTGRWSQRFIKWLREEMIAQIDSVVAVTFDRLVDRYEAFHSERVKLDRALRELARAKRYALAHKELRKIPGVGLLVAMTFLTEMGDLSRFENRRQLGAYLGLVPSSHESGQSNDRKGRITRQGPSRLRKLLCQAAWVGIRHDESAAKNYHRIKQGQNKRSKKAVVALMRKLGVLMWHRALACGVPDELIGRSGPLDLKPSVESSLVG